MSALLLTAYLLNTTTKLSALRWETTGSPSIPTDFLHQLVFLLLSTETTILETELLVSPTLSTGPFLLLETKTALMLTTATVFSESDTISLEENSKATETTPSTFLTLTLTPLSTETHISSWRMVPTFDWPLIPLNSAEPSKTDPMSSTSTLEMVSLATDSTT